MTYLILLVVFTVTGAKSYLPRRHVFHPVRRRRIVGRGAARCPAPAPWDPRLGGPDDRRPRDSPAPGVAGGGRDPALAKGPWEGSISKDLSATVGWQSLVAQIAEVSASLPAEQRAHLVILTGDYGAAGAVDLYGRSYGLPNAISGDNSYWWWGPADARNGVNRHRHRPAATVSTEHLLRGHLGGHRDDPRRGME